LGNEVLHFSVWRAVCFALPQSTAPVAGFGAWKVMHLKRYLAGVGAAAGFAGSAGGGTG